MGKRKSTQTDDGAHPDEAVHQEKQRKQKKKRDKAAAPAAAEQQESGPSQAAAQESGAQPGTSPEAAAGAAQAQAQEAPAQQHKPGKPAPVLPWMRVPVAIEAAEGILLEEVQGLDRRLRAALEATGIEVLFPVQTVVWQETAGGTSAAHDICISAPTGSGKTLSYALPILQALSRHTVPGLRALVVLPTRDLALQVYQVFASLCPSLGLSACVACGKASLAAEAELLASGFIDILIATPGRLISHLEGTPGFDIRRLSFLVVDETDRLLKQAYQDWLPKLLAAVDRPAAQQQGPMAAAAAAAGGTDLLQLAGGTMAAADAALAGSSSEGGEAGGGRQVVKFVVSATLTRDPSKLERLGLHCPRYIAMSAVDHRYKLPPRLVEYKIVVPAERKPLALAALLSELRGEPTIVFSGSVEATRRLCLLLQALRCLPDRVEEFSSLLQPEARRAALEEFRSGAAKVLVCSDAMTRGMDVEAVANVINYDAPVYVKTYVHRAGRTARAGRGGRVFTLLRHEDVKHFKGMLRKADNTYVRDHKLGREALEALKGDVDQALGVMQEQILEAEPQVAAAHGQQQRRRRAGEGGSSEQGKPSQDGVCSRAHKGPAKRRKVPGVMEFALP